MSGSFANILPSVCEYFDLGDVQAFKSAGGYANQNLVIETCKGSFLAKSLLEHGPDELNSEALYLERIAQTGYPCPRYLTGRDGGYLFQSEDQSVALMRYVDGEISDQISVAQTEQLGAVLARLHLIDGESLPARNTWWADGFLKNSLAYAKTRFDTEVLRQLENEHAALEHFEAEELPGSIVHGDPWPGNVLFEGDRLVALIDWEETTLGVAIFDLAYLAIHGCLSGRTFDQNQYDALISSYQSVRALSSLEGQLFGHAIRRVAYTNYLWLLLKAEPGQVSAGEHWAIEWYRGLELERLTVQSPRGSTTADTL